MIEQKSTQTPSERRSCFVDSQLSPGRMTELRFSLKKSSPVAADDDFPFIDIFKWRQWLNREESKQILFAMFKVCLVY